MMGKIPDDIFPLKFSFSIGYDISPKYRPMCVLVLVLDPNQNSGLGRIKDIIDPFDNRQLH